MNKKEAINRYNEYMKINKYYNYAISLINFDGTTIAPKSAVNERNDVMNYFSYELFKRQTSEEYEKIIYDLNSKYDTLSPIYKRICDISIKSLKMDKKIPPKEMEQFQMQCSDANYYWEVAKNKNDYKIYKPYLEKVMNSCVKFASYYGKIDGSYYNSFLDMYEEGITEKELDEFFDTLKKRIVPLLLKIKQSSVRINDDFAKRKISKRKQLEMGNYVAKTIGYDLKRGVISETEHPFTDSLCYNDVRLTTHVYLDNFMSNIYSIAHEGGHGIYAQNINKSLYGTILHDGASMAFHESQSRFYENIIARSKPFCDLIFPKIKKIAGKALDDVTSDDFYLAANKVAPSLIRTEADELTYCLHIMVRYEIEKMIMNKQVDYDTLPKLWNKLYKEYLGVEVTSDKEGILQDVHWTSGVGYFFSYALGNAYSAQIYNAMKKDIDVDKLIASNKLGEIKKWLIKHMYCYGNLLKPKDLIVKVTGESLNPEYYCKYLEEKYSKIYHLK